jgi:hypothetical protein
LAKTKFHLQRRLKVFFSFAKDVIYFIATVEFAKLAPFDFRPKKE